MPRSGSPAPPRRWSACRSEAQARAPRAPRRGPARARRRASGAQRPALAGLPDHPREEHRVAEQVAAPHPLRLDRRVGRSIPAHCRPTSAGRAARARRRSRRARRRSTRTSASSAVGVALHPQLLLGRPHADQHDVGPRGVDVLEHPLVVRRADARSSRGGRPRPAAAGTSGCRRSAASRGDAGLGAEQVDRAARRPRTARPGPRSSPRRSCGAGSRRRARGRRGARRSRRSRRGRPARSASRSAGTLARLVEHVRVDVHHAPRAGCPRRPTR